MASLKLGFIGAGFIAKFQAQALHHVRGIELVGVHALKGSEELAASVCEAGIGDCKVYRSVAELCNACDAVAVFAPNYARVDLVGQIVDAIQAGANLKGIVCEKPLGRTVAEARQLDHVAKRDLTNLPTNPTRRSPSPTPSAIPSKPQHGYNVPDMRKAAVGLKSRSGVWKMAVLESKRLGIAEVSEMTGVAPHVLRQWEARFPS